MLYDDLVRDLSLIEKHSLGIEGQPTLAAGDEISFAPQFFIGSFHVELGADLFRLFDGSPDFTLGSARTW